MIEPPHIAPVHGAAAAPAPATVDLTSIDAGACFEVVAVSGDDPLAHRLVAAGLWPGALIERIARAPFGDPLLFRLHGYRLALRRTEAARVQVRRAGSVA